MPEITNENRAKESAFLYTAIADTGMAALLILVAVLSGSLTILGEAARSTLMLVIGFYTYWLLISVHRGRLTRFEFGVAKIEQFVWLIVGLGLVVGGLWIAQNVVDTIFSGRPAASPLGLTLAAVTNAVNSLINVVGWYAMVSASRDDDSEVYRAELRARVTMMTSSLFLQVTLTVAALAKDDVIALFLDAAGATFVTYIMLFNGFSMIAKAVPHLLDAPASADLRELIRRSVAEVAGENNIVSIRTRRAGGTTFAEVAVLATALPSIAALTDTAAAVEAALAREGVAVDLAIVPARTDAAGQGAT
ncbi:MAG: cation transporter [Alphaproteobacteria bacterium]|nr:cation transporter [Alphaproteobacteria bacterium]